MAANTSAYAVAVNDLTVAYREKPVLWDIDLQIAPGTLMGVIGPNGAGKSTLIKAILGLVRPASGEVRIFGKPYAQQRRLVGYVPQRGTVDWDFPTSVLDVVMMGLYGQLGWVRRPGKAERALALESLEKVGMAALASRQISQLSGGQQQRAFLARALVQDAQVYLMDEPFVGVDATTEHAILTLLRELQQAGRTVVVVHHDLETVAGAFDEVTILNVELIASGSVAMTLTPENLRRAYGARMVTRLEVGDGQ
jgi:manganese/zinc/iron transport system ATP- binding protein